MDKRSGNSVGGFTLVEIMIILLIIGILVGIGLPSVLRSKMVANDTFAKQALRMLSSASEWFSGINSSYPVSEAALLSAAPPYIRTGYCATTVSGYAYTCAFSTTAYTLVATPTIVGITGTTTYTMSTGGLLVP